MLSISEEEVVRILVPSRNFEVIYNLDCTGLCSEFMEDIEFRFSLGLTALLTKYMGKNTTDDYEVFIWLPYEQFAGHFFCHLVIAGVHYLKWKLGLTTCRINK